MSDQTAGLAVYACAVVSSREIESGFIAEDQMSPVQPTPACPGSTKIFQHCLWCRISSKLLNGRRPIVSECFSLIPSDAWKVVFKWLQIDVSRAFCVDLATFIIAGFSSSFVFLTHPGSPWRLTLPSVFHCCQLPRHSDRGGDWYFFSTCFSEAYYTTKLTIRVLSALPPNMFYKETARHRKFTWGRDFV